MDLPPYGRGPEGEKWTLQEKLDELVLLSHHRSKKKITFFILSMYAVGAFGNDWIKCGEIAFQKC